MDKAQPNDVADHFALEHSLILGRCVCDKLKFSLI